MGVFVERVDGRQVMVLVMAAAWVVTAVVVVMGIVCLFSWLLSADREGLASDEILAADTMCEVAFTTTSICSNSRADSPLQP